MSLSLPATDLVPDGVPRRLVAVDHPADGRHRSISPESARGEAKPADAGVKRVASAGVAGCRVPVEPVLESLARCVVEVLSGSRELDQLARWVSDEVYQLLMQRVVLSARARRVTGQRAIRPAFTIGRTLVSEPVPGVVEGVVVVHGKARSRAVAIRLERVEERWRAAAITVL